MVLEVVGQPLLLVTRPSIFWTRGRDESVSDHRLRPFKRKGETRNRGGRQFTPGPLPTNDSREGRQDTPTAIVIRLRPTVLRCELPNAISYTSGMSNEGSKVFLNDTGVIHGLYNGT